MLFPLINLRDEKSGMTKNKNALLDDLILQISKNKSVAMAEFYGQTKSAVYGFALAMVKNHQTAEDIMQDTYIRVFESAKKYHSQNKPLAWLLTITKNLALTKLQHQSEKELNIEDYWLPAGKDFSQSSIDKMFLHKMLNTLTMEERQIVILNTVVGLKHREIAALLDLPLPTALSKYYRALSKLKKMLKEEAN